MAIDNKTFMLGDWVFSTIINKPCKVIGIDPIGDLGKAGYSFKLLDQNNRMLFVRKTAIEPIPLTEEILEKNGWKRKLWWEHSDVGLYMSKITDGTWEIQTDKDSEFSTLCSIRYVHELQHLLLLCGIEKEIVL